jgi:hypothetical protein
MLELKDLIRTRLARLNFESDRRIDELKREAMTFLEELPNKEGKLTNAIPESPDGQYFFLFSYDGEF